MFNKVMLTTASLFLVFGLAPIVSASDVDDLTQMLEEFLAAAHRRAAHERFWADDLVYTSSSGLRFGKADIMEGFEQDDSEEDQAPVIVYSGEDIDVRTYGTTAVMAFKLVGTPADTSADVSHYFNTGTFLKRNGDWKVVAWQATKIPPGD